MIGWTVVTWFFVAIAYLCVCAGRAVAADYFGDRRDGFPDFGAPIRVPMRTDWEFIPNTCVTGSQLGANWPMAYRVPQVGVQWEIKNCRVVDRGIAL